MKLGTRPSGRITAKQEVTQKWTYLLFADHRFRDAKSYTQDHEKCSSHRATLLIVLSTFAQDEHKANTVRIPDVATEWNEKINLIQICR